MLKKLIASRGLVLPSLHKHCVLLKMYHKPCTSFLDPLPVMFTRAVTARQSLIEFTWLHTVSQKKNSQNYCLSNAMHIIGQSIKSP